MTDDTFALLLMAFLFLVCGLVLFCAAVGWAWRRYLRASQRRESEIRELNELCARYGDDATRHRS